MTNDRRTAERRRVNRRAQPAPAAEPESAALADQALVPVEPPLEKPPAGKSRRGAIAAFAAQILGQGGQKRGLRGGPPALKRAGASYLGAEWSGPADRRSPPGRITKTDI